MDKRRLRANFFLLITACVWGVAFAFQKQGADYLGAFSFNGIRFTMAAIALIPVIYVLNSDVKPRLMPNKTEILAGICAGSALYFASFLQQAGIAHTTAGKAAFITGLYMVLVPIYGLFLKQRVHITIWIAVILAAIGMYFLSIDEKLTIQRGDVIVFVGAFIWATHIIIVDTFNPKVNPLKFSWLQFVTAAFFSMITAFILERETLTISNMELAAVPLLYAGICSAGIGYTLQIIGQKDAKPAPATLILSLEAVFAVAGGYFILGEVLNAKEILGCVLMVAGMLLAQYNELTRK